MKILVLNGPNLNMLGKREPSIYGQQTYKDLVSFIKKVGKEHQCKIKIKQSNKESYLIDCMQKADLKYDYVLLNAGGFTHTSVALGDAIKCCQIPVLEVHLSDVDNREAFRKINYIRANCIKCFSKNGFNSYKDAILYIVESEVKEKC